MKRKIGMLALLGTTFFSLVVAFTATIAWFSSVGFTFDNDRLGGKSQGAYFAYGTGTEDDPYGITNTRHLNNLAWLQYMGTFNNKDLDGDGVEERYHFELAANVNENGSTYVMPPIGTEKNPFTGVFKSKDGQNYTINNIKITNDELAFSNKPAAIPFAEEYSSDDPSAVDYATDKAEVVGFFGYVGDKPTDNYTPDTSSSISNFSLENITVESKTSNTLIGIAVGYLDGDMSGVTVGKSSINVNNNNAKTNYTSNLSDYGLVGHAADSCQGTIGTYSQKVSAKYSSGEGTGPGTDWGGSISIRDLNLRLYNMMNVTSDNGIATDNPATSHPTASTSNVVSSITTNKTFLSKLHARSTGAADQKEGHRYYKDNYNIATVALHGRDGSNSSNYNMDLSPETNNVLYSLEGPGDKTITYKGTTYTTAVPGTALPLIVEDDPNEKQNGYRTSANNNTGYIVGGDMNKNITSTTSYQSRTSVRTSSVGLDKIENSINSTTTYNSNNLEIITNSTEEYGTDNYTRISDKYNLNNDSVSDDMAKISKNKNGKSLIKYEKSRAKLDGFLNGSSRIHGLHFQGGANYPGTSINEIMTLGKGYIYDEEISDYQVLKHSIDFNIKETGYINFFAGTYQAGQIGADSFFSLYVVQRNNNKKNVSKILKIEKIFKNQDESTKKDYPYLYYAKDGNTYVYTTGQITKSSNEAGSLVFDMRFLSNTPPVKGALYYFEIPVNSGEFAMGVVPSTNGTALSSGAYLIYLDLGASGNTIDDINSYAVSTYRSGFTYPKGIDFNTSDLISTSGGKTLAIIISINSSGTVSFDISDTSITYESDFTTRYAYSVKTVTGETHPDNAVAPPSKATRLITSTFTSEGENWKVVIEDVLDGNDNVTSSSYKEIIKGNVDETGNPSVIPEDFLTAMTSTIRSVISTNIVELERKANTGSDTFDAKPTYTTSNNTTTVDISLDCGSSTIIVKNIPANGYVIKINGTTKTNNQEYTMPSQA